MTYGNVIAEESFGNDDPGDDHRIDQKQPGIFSRDNAPELPVKQENDECEVNDIVQYISQPYHGKDPENVPRNNSAAASNRYPPIH